jgi:hypothetical protein
VGGMLSERVGLRERAVGVEAKLTVVGVTIGLGSGHGALGLVEFGGGDHLHGLFRRVDAR